MKLSIYLACCCAAFFAFVPGLSSQTLGGQSAYNFLKIPASPYLAGAGGVNVSYRGEVGLTAYNPALLHQDLSSQVQASFNSFLAGTKAYSLTGAFHAPKLGTTFGGHVNYLDYGSIPYTDAAGNQSGTFRPIDFVVQVSAARRYLQKWTYGLSLKYIQSSYGQYKSSAIAADVAVLYFDSTNNFSTSFLARNMGGQIATYSGQREELPFDVQVGFTKRLRNAPFGFSVTAQHLQTFDILYNDTLFNRDNNLSSSSSTFTKLVTHLVFASHLYLGQSIEATFGYNLLKRRELKVGNEGNGLTGFSAGLRVKLPRLQLLYARTAYQRGVASNQIGLTLQLDRLFGLGY